jgi:putative transposase
LIKTFVTKHYGDRQDIKTDISISRQKRKERNLWQRRFWEHFIRDEKDFGKHCDYIHYNPVRHRLCNLPQDWKYSTIHRLIAQGVYPPNLGIHEIPEMPESIWDM